MQCARTIRAPGSRRRGRDRGSESAARGDARGARRGRGERTRGGEGGCWGRGKKNAGGGGGARTTKAGSPRPAWYAAPVASAVTRELCEDGNPPLPTIRLALKRRVTVHSLNGLSTCATMTAMTAATSPTLSPSVFVAALTVDGIANRGALARDEARREARVSARRASDDDRVVC